MLETKININGLGINYKFFGKEYFGIKTSDRPIFLILHGWGGSSESWRKVAECLALKYDVYAIDFPCFGKSDSLKEEWTLDSYVGLIEKFIAATDIKECSIIGHSFGGRVAIKLAVKDVHWLKKIYLCASAGIKHPLTFKRKIFFYAAKSEKWLLGAAGKNSVRNFLRKNLYRLLGEKDYYNCEGEAMKETFGNILDEDLTNMLKRITLPSVIIWGKKDKYTPLSDGVFMHREIKNSKMRIIEEAGHGIHLQAAEKLCKILTTD